MSTSRFSAPLPLLLASAGATVAITALWLAATEQTGESADRSYHVATIPSSVATPAKYVASGLFLAVALAALVSGFVGRQVAAGNLATVFWGSQVALIVLGHVVAVVAAHYVAVDRYGSVAAVRRGHVPLVVLMAGYTALSLWIISQPVVAG